MYKDVVTVFNEQRSRDGSVWYPTVLTGVNLNMDRGAVVARYGEASLDNAILNVRYKSLTGEAASNLDGGTFMNYDGGVQLDGGDFDNWDGTTSDGGNFVDWDALITRSITWLPPKAWKRLENKDGFVTFAPGDFFWTGVWTGAGAVADDNYGDLSFFEYMTQNYDYVFKVTTTGLFTVIPHLEIAGR